MRPMPPYLAPTPSKPFSLTLAKHGFCCFSLCGFSSSAFYPKCSHPHSYLNHFQKLPSCQGPAEDYFPLLEATLFFLLFIFGHPKNLSFGSYFPDQGSNLPWECGILTTGPAGSPHCVVSSECPYHTLFPSLLDTFCFLHFGHS